MSKKFHEICDLMASPLSGVQAPDKTFLYLSNNPYTNSNAADSNDMVIRISAREAKALSNIVHRLAEAQDNELTSQEKNFLYAAQPQIVLDVVAYRCVPDSLAELFEQSETCYKSEFEDRFIVEDDPEISLEDDEVAFDDVWHIIVDRTGIFLESREKYSESIVSLKVYLDELDAMAQGELPSETTGPRP